jgi:KDO2-lipid IV(A) lauroyltransferase
MKAIGFYVFFGINYLITLLPLRVLYLFSDFFYLILYYLAGYRRKVVAANLRNAFPEKSESERLKIERSFYKHLADLLVETLKATHMSAKQIIKRFKVRDWTLGERLCKEGRDMIVICSHYNNWEWLSSLPITAPYTGMTVYKPLNNKYFDRFILNLRTQYGVIASPMQQILRNLVTFRRKDVRTGTAFIADQTPPRNENVYWTTFLNQDTDFYRGAEKVAIMLDMAVVYLHVIKVKRGYYEVDLKLITEHPRAEKPDFITARSVEMIEETIRDKPEYWLWSHRRWKHKKPVNND